MAVLIASELRKEFAGDPLFENVSFTVGRKDRLSLAGANGAGKTTLLRAIARETSIQGGKLAFAKGTRVALHDQRPPLEYDISLRDYALSGARYLLELPGRHRPQAVRGDAEHIAACGALAQRVDQHGKRPNTVNEPALAFHRRQSAEAGVRVENGQ